MIQILQIEGGSNSANPPSGWTARSADNLRSPIPTKFEPHRHPRMGFFFGIRRASSECTFCQLTSATLRDFLGFEFGEIDSPRMFFSVVPFEGPAAAFDTPRVTRVTTL